MIPTLVWTIAVLCCLIFFTVWYTSTTASVLIRSIKFVNAMNTPVRPTPALEIKNERYRKQLTHFNLFLPSIEFNIETSYCFCSAKEGLASIWKETLGKNWLSQCFVSVPPERIPKTSGFLMFSEVTEMGHWLKVG